MIFHSADVDACLTSQIDFSPTSSLPPTNKTKKMKSPATISNQITGALLACLIPLALSAQTLPRYQESEGIVVVEIESALNYGEWALETDLTGYTGEGYLHYKGENFYSNPGNSLLNFEIVIEKPGRYRFQWHSKIAIGDSNTEHNDSWLRFKDASDFYGEKNGQRVYPKGTDKTPNPNGTSKDGWLKIYQNNQNNWTWVTRTSDHDPHEIYVEFDTAGVYSLEVSGRSNGHAINRIALYHEDASSAEALDLTRSESQRLDIVAVQEIAVRAIKLRPTIARNNIFLELPPSLPTGEYQGQIINLRGQYIQSFSFYLDGQDELTVPVGHLGRGSYFIRVQEGLRYFQAKFIKP